MDFSDSTSPEEFKSLGTAQLSQGHIDKAIQLYQLGLGRQPLSKDTELALLLNLSLCHSKLPSGQLACIELCNKVLEKDAVNAKALFRRSKAYIALERYQEAALDAKALQRYYPKNAAGRDLIMELTKTLKESESGCRKLVTDACKPGADPALMKQLLGAVAEDEGRAKECVSKNGVRMLLEASLQSPLAFNVISRCATYASCLPQVALQVKQTFGEQEWFEILAKVVANRELAGLHSAAALMLLQRLTSNVQDSAETTALLLRTDFVDSLMDPRVQVREVAIEACGSLYSQSREMAELFVDKLDGIESLSEVCRQEFQLAALCLSRIIPALIKLDKSKDDLVALHCRKLCQSAFQDLALDAQGIEQVRHGLNCLLALFHASHDIALEVVAPDAGKLGVLVTSAPDSVVSLVAEILAQMGNSERGRAVLGSLSKELHALLGHSNPAIRAAASVAITKIEAVHFDSNSEQGALVLGSVGHLFRPEATWEEVAKGIEAVSFVVQDTDVKMMLATGAEGSRVLQAICNKARELKEYKEGNVPSSGNKDELSNESAFGIAYLLQNLTMDEDDKKREKLREMEVSQEQWEQFEKITKQKSSQGNSRKDSPEEVAARVDSVVQCGGVSALRHLILAKPNARMAQAVSKAMVNLAGQQRLRGQMIAQGAVSCLLRAHKLGKEEEQEYKRTHTNHDTYRGSPICRDATHALARLLISTDPRLLPHEHVMDCVAPLVEQIRKSDIDLVVFECCMALTNLEVVGDVVKDKVSSLNGISALEYAQFSENVMVRRSATEAIANLVPCDGLFKFLAFGDKVRLWLLFTEDFESDELTSKAAAGLLAQVSCDPLVASRIRRFGGAQRLAKCTMETGNGDIVWRIMVALQSLKETEYVDTQNETTNESQQNVVSNDGSWQIQHQPWSPEEQRDVTVAMMWVSRFQVENLAVPGTEAGWNNAKRIADEWLETNDK
ncbi:hypothetical protein BASA81_003087 [Batrachochytrium salamandrivorans]|nr:hypothetical protein BASA81_003087 [Batrachochytrium salamandrivorans]